jgi:8-oxo-dGTP pyrophosphatase MutT (NUDIX family)/2'-5' RNA ligase
VPRLGVVALLPEPVSTYVQAWRRALREPFHDAVAPHITLVPPQQVPGSRLADALDLVRDAASALPPARVVLDGAASFLPRNPVAFLVVAEGGPALVALEAALRRAPLERRGYPFHPHVTVAQELEPARIDQVVAELAGFRAAFTCDRIALMREQGGRWRAEAMARLGGGDDVTEAPFDQAASAAVLVVDRGRVLLGHRTERPGYRYPGRWDAVGGKPDPGEPLLAALAREAEEEAGIEPLDLTAIGCFHDGDRADAYYLATTWRGTVENRAPAEHERLEWVALERVFELDLVPTLRRAIARYAGVLTSRP